MNWAGKLVNFWSNKHPPPQKNKEVKFLNETLDYDKWTSNLVRFNYSNRE